MDTSELLEQMMKGVDYGTVHLTIKRHDSRVTSVDGQKMTTHKTEGNEGALAIIIALLKAASANKESGNLTFTVVLDHGGASRMIVSDMKRVVL